MTTAAPTESITTRPSVHVMRARKLLFAGLTGGVAAAIIAMILFGLLNGTPGLISAALAAAMVLFFYAVGQLVMVIFADAGAQLLMMVSMGSYFARVAILGLALLLYDKNREALPSLIPVPVFVTTIAVVAGWLAVEVFVFSRLRIGIYDTPYVDPVEEATEEGESK